MQNQLHKFRGFTVRAFSSGQKRNKQSSINGYQTLPKGILRNSPEPTMCVYCDQNNSLIYGKDTLRSRVGNMPGCQMCSSMNPTEQKKRVRFDSVVRERNFIKSDDEQPSGKKYRKISQKSKSAKPVKPSYTDAMFACSICKISLKTESDFITHQRKHAMQTIPNLQYNMPHQYQEYRHISPLLFFRQ